MSDDNYHTHDIRDWNGEAWHFMDGRPYRKAKTFAEVTAELAEQEAALLKRLAEFDQALRKEVAAQAIPDPIAVLKRVKRIE